jgi:uncharacterized membrane protein
MFSIGEVKSTALKSLKGHWLVPCLLTLVIGAITTALSIPSMIGGLRNMFEYFVSGQTFDNFNDFELFSQVYGQTVFSSLLANVFSIISFIAAAAIAIAHSRFFLALIKDPDKTNFSTFLEGLVYWGKGILALLWMSLWLWLWGLLLLGILGVLLIIPAIAGIDANFLMNLYEPPPAVVIAIVAIFPVWIIAACIVLLNRTYAYSQILFVQAEYPTVSVTKSLKASIAMTKGVRGKLFLLDLSFIGWGLLALLTAGIGYIWLEPYMSASQAAAYLRLKQAAFEKGVFITQAQTAQALPPQSEEQK